MGNLLREHDLDARGLQRGRRLPGRLREAARADDWASDFVTKPVWTTAGLRDHFILFFIHLESRLVAQSTSPRDVVVDVRQR